MTNETFGPAARWEILRDGVTWNAVDPDRAARFMDAARAARQQAAAG